MPYALDLEAVQISSTHFPWEIAQSDDTSNYKGGSKCQQTKESYAWLEWYFCRRMENEFCEQLAVSSFFFNIFIGV